MSNLYLRDQYSAKNINYIISSYIREYDIEKANINILLKYGAISKSQYDRYISMDKLHRNISIGVLIRDNKDINNILKKGFVECRKLFFEENNIQDYEVLSIRKDAIYLINTIPKVLDFDGVRFIEKNIYTSFYKLPKLDLYYYSDIIRNIEYLNIKGIRDDRSLQLHENYILDFLKYLFELAQSSNIDVVITTISNFYKQYINLELEAGYYRELNPMSKFNINTNLYKSYYADMIDRRDIKYLNISYNRIILETLYSYYSAIYLSK